jgi:hypothetical protein
MFELTTHRLARIALMLIKRTMMACIVCCEMIVRETSSQKTAIRNELPSGKS